MGLGVGVGDSGVGVGVISGAGVVVGVSDGIGVGDSLGVACGELACPEFIEGVESGIGLSDGVGVGSGVCKGVPCGAGLGLKLADPDAVVTSASYPLRLAITNQSNLPLLNAFNSLTTKP